MLLHVRHLPVVTESLFDDGLGPVLAYPSRIAPRAAVGLEPLTWAQTSDLPTLQGFGSTFFCSLCRTMCASGTIHRPQQVSESDATACTVCSLITIQEYSRMGSCTQCPEHPRNFHIPRGEPSSPSPCPASMGRFSRCSPSAAPESLSTVWQSGDTWKNPL